MEQLKMNKKDVVESPKDVLLDAVIIKVNKTTWAEIISPDKIKEFDEPDKEIVQIEYECKFDNRVIKNNDTFNYFEKPMSNSKLGMFLIKYGELDVGQSIKVDFNGKGIPKIKVE